MAIFCFMAVFVGGIELHFMLGKLLLYRRSFGGIRVRFRFSGCRCSRR